MKNLMKISRLLLILALITTTLAQTKRTESFEEIEMLRPDNKTVSVRVIFLNDIVRVVDKKNGTTLKIFRYADLKRAEYSYSEDYRWQKSWTLTALGFVVPPLWLVSIPIGFTRSKDHWITFLSHNDYVVLKLNKLVRKLFIPSFEVHTGLRIEAMGDKK
jgi:hypothetical protein